MPEKPQKLSLKTLTMLPSYFDYIFGHLRQKARIRPELSRKFCQLRPEPDPKSPARLITLVSMHHSIYNQLKGGELSSQLRRFTIAKIEP